MRGSLFKARERNAAWPTLILKLDSWIGCEEQIDLVRVESGEVLIVLEEERSGDLEVAEVA